jgi:hypothetical protein
VPLAPEVTPPPAEPAVEAPAPVGREEVTIGAYVNDIQSIDLKTHTYAVDLYLWFRWRNAALSPAQTLEFINPSELWGHTRGENFEAPVELPNGEHYQILRVQGRFSRKMPLFNYPFDHQSIVVEFEDSLLEAPHFGYVPDDKPIVLNPELTLPGFILGTPRLEIVPRSYPTNFGDLRIRDANVYSRARLILPISRPAWTYTLKLLLPVLCVLVCAALMFLLKPTYTDSRVGIGITSLLTIVALQMTLNDDLPEVDYLVLMDKLYIGAYVYVISGLGIVVRTTRLADEGDVARADRLSRRALVVLSSLCAALMTGLILWSVARG